MYGLKFVLVSVSFLFPLHFHPEKIIISVANQPLLNVPNNGMLVVCILAVITFAWKELTGHADFRSQ